MVARATRDCPSSQELVSERPDGSQLLRETSHGDWRCSHCHFTHSEKRRSDQRDRREGALFGTHYVMISSMNSGRGQFRGGRGM